MLCFLLGVAASCGTALAQDGQIDPLQALDRFDRQATAIEERFRRELLSGSDLPAALATLTSQRDQIPELKERVEARIAPLRQQLEALGPPPEEGESEAESVARERGALRSRLDQIEAIDLRLDQADARALGLIDRVNALRRDILTTRLQTREASPLAPSSLLAAASGFAEFAQTLRDEVANALAAERMQAGAVGLRLLAPIAVAIFIAVLLNVTRRALIARIAAMITEDMPPSRRILVGIAVTASRLFLPALGVALVVVLFLQSGMLGLRGEALLRGLGRAAMILIATFALANAFFAPRLPALRLSNLDDRSAAVATRWALVLAAVYGLDGPFAAQAVGVGLSLEAATFANFVLLSAGGFALWRFERALGAPQSQQEAAPSEDAADDADAEPEEQRIGLILLQTGRLLLLGVAILAPLLALAGYAAASRIVFYNPLATAALIGAFVLLFTVVRAGVEALMVGTAAGDGAGRSSGQSDAQAATQAAGLAGGRIVGRLRLIPVFVGFVLVCAAVPLIALIWGATGSDLIAAWQLVRSGVSIGEIRLQPLDFFSFVAVFALVYLAMNVVRLVFARSVLPVTGIDAGGRAAINAGIGYLGVILAALAAIAATGLDLSNIALVAGALSVGIGFGLQTVVSNFVSGLILLVERPIKAGDWVQLPSGMGYVKRVNVRATIIETFDRAALIVPNQELIGSTVINWTHNNLNGRIIVAIKVAMDSDPREVERIMVEIARAHPMVLRRPQPFVLFRGYSDYAMNFEVRAVLRDVNWILNVQSDFHFEIHRRFAEAGIEIPVQQTRVSLERVDADHALASPVESGTAMLSAPTPGPRRLSPVGPAGLAEGGDGDGDGR
ncbi:MAG: mechanosensitive ion channel domain-containing protein [Pseudomonadota bacterium]